MTLRANRGEAASSSIACEKSPALLRGADERQLLPGHHDQRHLERSGALPDDDDRATRAGEGVSSADHGQEAGGFEDHVGAGGPERPRHLLGVVRVHSRAEPELGDAPAAKLGRLDEDDGLGPADGDREADREADDARAEHDDEVSLAYPRPVDRVTGHGERLRERPARRVVVLGDAVGLGRARHEPPGEGAVELDAEHLEPLAAIVSAAPALRALAALERRLGDD